MNTPAANEFHQLIRMTQMQHGIEGAIEFVRRDILKRGRDAVKADPGMRAWIEENRDALTQILAKSRGVFG